MSRDGDGRETQEGGAERTPHGYTDYEQARWTQNGTYEPLLSEKDSTRVEIGDDVDSPLPEGLTREELTLPQLSEPELARHYTRLSQMVYGIDTGPYPLGSCTMKYNPKFTEDVAALPDAAVHPDRKAETVQGTLEVLYRLQEYLGRIGGMDAVSLQPPAGAAGEFVGIRVAAAYHADNGGEERTDVIIPESAHGTNFATAALGGYDVVSLPSDEGGRVDLGALEAALSERTAALMLTNPNTLGLFERDITRIAELVHDAGGLLYYDGANLNALLGRARPGDMGFDVMHYNVHKTFATPHGGGGPGAGPVGVVSELAPYLPAPRVRRRGDGNDASYELFDPESTIGTVHGYQGNWLVLLKAFAYIARLGDEGLTDASAKAVLNANYLASRLEYEVPYGPFHHEFVASAGAQDAADVAKRMLDYGVHPPTTKWPEIVPEALMTEPTEVENKASLDDLAAAFNAVANEERETLERAPERTSARRIDQASAAREPRLSWHALEDR
ncbi:aminomethyl-transferring glycine dehydrogenase subunit GcvPB [Natronobiforma cellulositropha]|uniref:aminomethyl-transferring glycine dehydrogenase subunit GcvPB n=1 Tax=Natronobiforma cellulositropha TaxID=1679076 RepID=UPI0021D608C9|nr:aminomethyl-transferring glycine dehydrogenase subunit GcvPB [Natronobiforma cellulositropha]